jgi:hypothetical protein
MEFLNASVPHVPVSAAMPSTKQQRRGAANKPGANACAKQQMKLNGNQYVHRCLTLEMQIAAQQQQLQDAEVQQLAARTKEQVWPTWQDWLLPSD